MTPGQWAVAYLGTAAIVIMGLFWLTIRIAYKDGHNDGRAYERNRRNTRALEIARREPTRLLGQAYAPYQPGRHAPWQPRLTVTRAMAVAIDGGPSALTAPISNRYTDTGELAARADRWIQNMERQEAAHRGELVS